MNIDEGAEIDDPPSADIVDQGFYGAEVLDPERNRRMLEKPPRERFAGDQPAPAFLALAHVLGGNENAAPVVLEAGQDARLELDIQTAARQRIVDRVAGERGLSLPQLDQFLAVAVQHVAGKDPVEIGGKMVEAVGLEQRQRAGVDGDELDSSRRGLHALQILFEMLADRGDPGLAPFIEQCLDAAEILDPQRNRRKFEQAQIARGLGIPAIYS
ncbi:hypothetical protein [Aurantimonas marianensis]|uniref:hypothetical protein n=1 Tax=Aurantimonas marianensis TaxID=2920428 RepID=UPI00311AB2ED